jgi:putative phage-type endonuclease
MITQKQIEERLNGVGASDSSIIAGYSTFMSAYELYKIKRGELKQKESSERADIGNIIEAAIAEIFTMKTGVATRKSNQTIYHQDHDFIFCHLDRTINGGIPLEIKNTSQSKEWGQEEDGPDGVPIAYNIQVQHQMACCKKDMAFIAVLLWGNTLKVYEIPRDNVLIDMIIALDLKFWECVKTGVPPEFQYDNPTTVDLLKRLYPGTNGKTINLPESLMSWHEVLTESRTHRKRYQAVIDNVKAHIMAVMEDNAIGLLPDETGYVRKEDKNGIVRLSHKKKP